MFIKKQNGERHDATGRVVHQLGIGVEALKRWVNQAEIDGGLRLGMTSSESEVLKVARKTLHSAPWNGRISHGTLWDANTK